jgi:hypothetical protein
MQKDELIEQFIASFEKLDEMAEFPETHPLVRQFAVGSPDRYGRLRWRAMKVQTDPSHLDQLLEKLPARFPPLFEQLVLSYRWAEVDLRLFRLLANPPGPDLMGMLNEMEKPSTIWENLLPSGLIQFGMGPDMDFDPVCFDIRSRTKRKDYKIVKVDHEEILCNNRVRVVAELAPSFEQLMVQTIALANQAGKS